MTDYKNDYANAITHTHFTQSFNQLQTHLLIPIRNHFAVSVFELETLQVGQEGLEAHAHLQAVQQRVYLLGGL